MDNDTQHVHVYPEVQEVQQTHTAAQEGRTGGGNITLESIAVFLLLTFVVRIFADVLKRVRNGRSLRRSADETVDLLTQRILSALTTAEQYLGQGIPPPHLG